MDDNRIVGYFASEDTLSPTITIFCLDCSKQAHNIRDFYFAIENAIRYNHTNYDLTCDICNIHIHTAIN